MMHSIAPAGGEAWPLLLDEHGKIVILRNAFECLAAGKLLLQLKAAVPHGEFTGRVKALGVNEYMSSRYMACARLFDPDRDAALLTAVNSVSKLVGLLCLEPEEIEALCLGGPVRGLTLESLPSMTVRQLRKTLRQSREETDHVPHEKHKRLEEYPGKSFANSGLAKPTVSLSQDEKDLLRNYRRCSLKAKFHVAQAAELLAGI